MLIIKAGGSAITLKKELLKPKTEVIKSLAFELSGIKERFILVHGAGSYGHPLAKRFELDRGFKNPSQRAEFSRLRFELIQLNQLLIESLIERGMDALSIQPSACMICENKRIERSFLEPIKEFLEIGFVPVLYGDMVSDLELGFCVLSGDQIAVHLAKELGARKVIFGCDVDGIFTSDPKENEGAELMREIRFSELDSVIEKTSEVGDVTKGMMGKLREIQNLSGKQIEVDVINLTKPKRLRDAILDRVFGTRIF